MKKVSLFICAFLLFLVIESIWLKVMSKNFYQAEIGHLMRPDPNLVAAVLFFFLYIGALCFLVIYPQAQGSNIDLSRIFLMGGLFGLAAYGTYDLTCLALFKGFSIKVAAVDTLWGGVLTGTVSTLTLCLASKFDWLN